MNYCKPFNLLQEMEEDWVVVKQNDKQEDMPEQNSYPSLHTSSSSSSVSTKILSAHTIGNHVVGVFFNLLESLFGSAL